MPTSMDVAMMMTDKFFMKRDKGIIIVGHLTLLLWWSPFSLKRLAEEDARTWCCTAEGMICGHRGRDLRTAKRRGAALCIILSETERKNSKRCGIHFESKSKSKSPIKIKVIEWTFHWQNKNFALWLCTNTVFCCISGWLLVTL